MSAVPTSKVLRAAALFATVTSLSFVGAAHAEAPAKKQAVLFGSSSMNDAFGHLLAQEMGTAGYQVTRKGVAAAGFSRPDYRDVFDFAKALPVNENTDVVVVYLGMNDAQSFFVRKEERGDGGASRINFDDEAKWNAAYRERAASFFQGLCERGVKKVAVLLPVDVKSPVMQKRLDRIRDAQRAAAGDAKCATAISTAGDTGAFGSGDNALRVSDGVHMTPKGARVLWARIKDQVLGLTS